MAKKKEAEAPVEEAAAPAGKMTQREAVEKALAAGNDLPAEGVPYVLKEFGITLSNQAFSTIKSKINTAGGAKAKKRGRPAGSSNGATPRQPAKTPSAPGGLSLHVEAIKTLVETLGVDQVVSIARLFAK
jgi:hypothetical protein